MKTTLPTDSEARKDIPLLSGCFRYFPAALAGVARWSKLGNDKHNPGEPLHHARGKSMDHGDCILRHLQDIQDMLAAFDRGPYKIDTAALMDEADALSWRALALSQELHERFAGAPLAPAAKLSSDAQAPADGPLDASLREMHAESVSYGGTMAETGAHLTFEYEALKAKKAESVSYGGTMPVPKPKKAAWLCKDGDCQRPLGHPGEHID